MFLYFQILLLGEESEVTDVGARILVTTTLVVAGSDGRVDCEEKNVVGVISKNHIQYVPGRRSKQGILLSSRLRNDLKKTELSSKGKTCYTSSRSIGTMDEPFRMVHVQVASNYEFSRWEAAVKRA